MKNESGDFTHRAEPMPAARFRAQATGVGSTRAESERSGMRRSQDVIDAAPREQRVGATGYPSPTGKVGADGRVRHPDTGRVMGCG